MQHPGEEDLILYHYGEHPNPPALEEHLRACACCRSELDSIAAALEAADSHQVPEPGPYYEARVWRRLLGWMLTTPAQASRPAARARRSGMATGPWGAVSTLTRKELRFYIRDPRQRLVWTGTVIFVGLAAAGTIAGVTGIFDMRGRVWAPLMAPILVLFVGLPIALNLFGWERNAASYLFVLPAKPYQLLLGKNAAVATALADQAAERIAAPVLASLPSGWRNSPSRLQVRSYRGYHGDHQVHYTLAPEGFVVPGLGRVVLVAATPDQVTLTLDGVEHHYQVARYGDDRYARSLSGEAHLVAMPRFPYTIHEAGAGSLHAPMPGKVIRLDVTLGETVMEGQPVAVLEAMKMEHTVRSPVSGTVSEIRCAEGDQVVAGDLLVVVEEAG